MHAYIMDMFINACSHTDMHIYVLTVYITSWMLVMLLTHKYLQEDAKQFLGGEDIPRLKRVIQRSNKCPLQLFQMYHKCCK